MFKKIIVILFCTGICMGGWAQGKPEVPEALEAEYNADKRDIKVVKEYVGALKEAKMKKEAEAVVREYMAGCPVLQVGDKETYLLINEFVFSDPYSNVVEYGIYAIKKMKWDREEKQYLSKEERMRSIFKGIGSGVSGDEEIDKRYEALMLLSGTLKKEIARQCEPFYKAGKYELPEYDAGKIERLTDLVSKDQLLGQDGMRVKLAMARWIHEGDYPRVVRALGMVTDLQIRDITGNYVIGMMEALAEHLRKEDIAAAVKIIKRLCEQDEKMGGNTNYYNVLGKLYLLDGDQENGDKYTKAGNAVEAERMARFGDMFKGME